MRETWYVLEDNTVGNPAECTVDDAGVLRHKNGLAVAIGPHGHRSRSVERDVVPVPTKPTAKETKSEKGKRS